MSIGRPLRLLQGLFFAAILMLGAAPAWAQAIHLGNGTEPESLDIHQSSGVSEANIQRDLFEGLIAEGPDASLIPGAAESWEISEDGTLYTFHLREDAVWSNGDPVTAALLGHIGNEEISHVAAGCRWFEYLCRDHQLEPVETFHSLINSHYGGQLKPPFNVAARTAAGMNRAYYDSSADL